jgi:hypothetical protein
MKSFEGNTCKENMHKVDLFEEKKIIVYNLFISHPPSLIATWLEFNPNALTKTIGW